jgi:uncharacterized protein (DUF302 family)
MTDSLAMEVRLPLAFEAAVDATRAALKTEGFGILTEIDLRAAFKEKLGREFRPYTILGACNPPLAFAALTADPAIGLLLPCNVVVDGVSTNESLVRLTDPAALLAAAPAGMTAALRPVATDARQRMERVMQALRGVS